MRNKVQVLSSFWLKILALVSMTFSHIGTFLSLYGIASDCASLFLIIGRIAFPLYAFMLAEGLHKTHDRWNYILRLALIWAVIFLTEFVFSFVNPEMMAKVSAQAFTDLLCYALFITLLESKGGFKLLSLLPFGYVILSYVADVMENLEALDGTFVPYWTNYFPLWVRSGYTLFGFVLFLGFYYVAPLVKKIVTSEEKKRELNLGDDFETTPTYQSLLNLTSCSVLVVVTVIFWALSYLWPAGDTIFWLNPQTYALLAGLILFCYNGKRGYHAKWFTYANYLYYPVHIALLALIFFLSLGQF